MVPQTIKIGIPTAPTQAPFDGDGIIKPEGPEGNDNNGGLDGGAWAGIAIAGAAVVGLLAFLLFGRRGSENDDDNSSSGDNDLDQMSAQGNAKESLRAITNGNLLEDAPDTDCDTASDATSLASMNTGISTGVAATTNPSSYYASNSLLGGRPNDESVLSDSDGPSLFTDEEGFERNLNSGGGGLAGGKLCCSYLF